LASWPLELDWTFGTKVNLLPLPGFEAKFVQPVTYYDPNYAIPAPQYGDKPDIFLACYEERNIITDSVLKENKKGYLVER
jgi:hypothetical protein